MMQRIAPRAVAVRVGSCAAQVAMPSVPPRRASLHVSMVSSRQVPPSGPLSGIPQHARSLPRSAIARACVSICLLLVSVQLCVVELRPFRRVCGWLCVLVAAAKRRRRVVNSGEWCGLVRKRTHATHGSSAAPTPLCDSARPPQQPRLPKTLRVPCRRRR